jgi:hypothetical protein
MVKQEWIYKNARCDIFFSFFRHKSNINDNFDYKVQYQK